MTALNKNLRQTNSNRPVFSRNSGSAFSNSYTYRHPASYQASSRSEPLDSGSKDIPESEAKRSGDHRDQNVFIKEGSHIPYSYIDWGSALEAALTPLHKLLAPPAYRCLTCGKMISDSAKGYPEICAACYVSIPWIRQMKCSICGRAVGCPDCTRETGEPRHFVLNRSVVSYTPLMRDWLARFKFRGDEALGGVLARMVGEGMKRLECELSLNGSAPKTPNPAFFDLVTYVPVSNERMLERGFNQARLLAVEAARVGRLPLVELLQRARHTDKQSSKSRRQRLLDLDDIFLPSDDAGEQVETLKLQAFHKKQIKILLIDDVYTTGSTVDACAHTLQEWFLLSDVKADIYSLTWARS